jgi:tetratricopeptide (TPR) repeat protein
VEHPDTVGAMANLASTYSQQGEAETLQLEALELRKRTLGLEHPDIIRAMANLASRQGRHGEAEKLKVEVLELQKRVLGLEHPDTILASANLAITYQYQTRWDDAAELLAGAVTLG